MKRCLLIIPTCLLLAAVVVPAVGAQEEEGSAGLGSFAGMDFDKIRAHQLDLSPDGRINLVGEVDIESETLAIKADVVTSDETGDVLKAKGSPVRIRQGDTVRAECRDFTYYVESGKSILEGSPVIYQTTEEGTTKVVGGIIILTKDEEGNTGISVKMDPGSKTMPTIENIKSAPKASAPQEKKPATKVNDSPGLIRLPALE